MSGASADRKLSQEEAEQLIGRRVVVKLHDDLRWDVRGFAGGEGVIVDYIPIKNRFVVWFGASRERDQFYFAEFDLVSDVPTELDALRKSNELLTILAEGCPRHPSYRAKRKVNTFCQRCNAMQEARQKLAALDKEGA